MDDRIKFRHLQCFLAVAQQGSLQKAAAALSITQPAVSKTLQELEAHLAVRLFDRGRKGAVLTASGDAFARHAAASVRALRDAVASVTPAGPLGAEVVTLGVLPTVAPQLVPALLLRLDQLGSRTSLRVHTAPNPALLNQLRQRSLDLVIGRFAEPGQMVGLSFEHLYSDPLVLAVRPHHPLLETAAHQPGLLQRLHLFTLLLPTQGTAIRQSADHFLTTRGVATLTRTVETLAVSAAQQYAQLSDAVWLCPLGAASHALASGQLQTLPVDMAGTGERVGLSLRSDMAPTDAKAEVISALRLLGAAQRAVLPSDGGTL